MDNCRCTRADGSRREPVGVGAWATVGRPVAARSAGRRTTCGACPGRLGCAAVDVLARRIGMPLTVPAVDGRRTFTIAVDIDPVTADRPGRYARASCTVVSELTRMEILAG
jgi:hypothetical protein